MICSVEISTEDGRTWAFVLRHRDPTGHETALYHSRRGFPDLASAMRDAQVLAKACDRISPETMPGPVKREGGAWVDGKKK